MADERSSENVSTTLRIDQPETVYPIFRALASMERLDILNLLCVRSMNIRELSEALHLPMSSTAMHVQLLENAKLIKSVICPGLRGNIKLCSGCVRSLQFFLSPHGDTFHSANQVRTYELPIGSFSAIHNLKPTCGLGSETELIDRYDTPSAFYNPKRLDAQVMWWREGFVEYRFPLPDHADIQWLELSVEINPQTASYHAPWKSDISVSINGQNLGVWQSSAERSIRRGLLTPEWWNTINTQYGELKTWRVTSQNSYLGSDVISDTTLSDLDLYGRDSIDVRIGIDADAANIGGLVLFGKRFGDFEQAVVMRIGCNEEPVDC
ncbi:MAG: ArsR family transcriptional regulator [Eubacteriales bacterium]|nr:ArsR family transcriptional regulator [Eubacteriales bacterium]